MTSERGAVYGDNAKPTSAEEEEHEEDHRRPLHLARRGRGSARPVALPVLQRGDGRRSRRDHRRPTPCCSVARPTTASPAHGPSARRPAGRTRIREEARRHPQDRRVEPDARVHLEELRAARGRPRRGRHRVEERAGRPHRDERLGLGRPSVALRRTAGRAASPVAPDCRPQGHAPVRRGRDSVPLELVSSETFGTGVLNLVYAPGAAREGGYEEARASLPESES